MSPLHFGCHGVSKKLEIVCTVRSGVLIPQAELFNDEMATLQEGQQVVVTFESTKPDKIRSVTQNKSLHKYLSNVVKALNNAGFDQRGIMSTIGKGAPIPWSDASLKALWNSVKLARTGKASTTKMTTAEYGEDHRIFDYMISEATQGAVSCALPSRDSQSYDNNKH